MLGYLSADIICSVCFEERIISKDKYANIFSKSNGDYCHAVFIILASGSFKKLGSILGNFPVLAGEYSVT